MYRRMHNTRRSKQPVQFDLEIEKTARKQRKEFLARKAEEAFHLDKLFVEEEYSMVEKTLKQLATPDVTATPLSIVFPTLEKPLKLNFGFLSLLPKFYGRSNELPNMHLIAFDLTCSSMECEGVKSDDIKLRAFPFSLEGTAKEWLFYLPSGSITSWDELKIAFLEKFQPASRVASIRKEISGIKQGRDESLCEYWERFNRLCVSCPQHQISEQLLLFYFYEGLLTKDRCYIDAASGGMLAEKTATEARALINNMALNTQQFSTRRDVSEVSAISDSDFISVKNQMQENAQQIATLTTLISKLAAEKSRESVCGVNSERLIANDVGQSKLFEDVNGIEGFNNQSYRKYSPYSNTYNEGWKDHPNLRYGFGSKAQQNNFRQQNSQPSTSLEEMMKQLTNTVSQVHNQSVSYQQKTDAHLHQLDTQMSQICTTLSDIETTISGKLPAQPIPNPKDRVLALRLRKRSDLKLMPFETECDDHSENINTKRRIPLTVGINLVPKYAELFMKYMDANCISVEEIADIPLCSFMIPCGIGAFHYEECLLDLGADVNTLSLHIYESYEFGPLVDTTSILELGDGSTIQPLGVLENIIVKVGNFEFMSDFYVTESHPSFSILLGKPFLRSSRAIIDVAKGEVILKYAQKELKINIYDISRHPYILEYNVFNLEDYCLEMFGVNVIEILLDEMAEKVGLERMFELAVEELADT
ncbi:hypothetical protein RND81_05G052200 [Saponaria officinalis]|uniref:Retrotransposon gag domain-containing protein n=2 Tax=Saponaria officinalis TaxID=3572 RepID=A0AAW1KTW2_SAPOF